MDELFEDFFFSIRCNIKRIKVRIDDLDICFGEVFSCERREMSFIVVDDDFAGAFEDPLFHSSSFSDSSGLFHQNSRNENSSNRRGESGNSSRQQMEHIEARGNPERITERRKSARIEKMKKSKEVEQKKNGKAPLSQVKQQRASKRKVTKTQPKAPVAQERPAKRQRRK